jgi:hypothetical protein
LTLDIADIQALGYLSLCTKKASLEDRDDDHESDIFDLADCHASSARSDLVLGL